MNTAFCWLLKEYAMQPEKSSDAILLCWPSEVCPLVRSTDASLLSSLAGSAADGTLRCSEASHACNAVKHHVPRLPRGSTSGHPRALHIDMMHVPAPSIADLSWLNMLPQYIPTSKKTLADTLQHRDEGPTAVAGAIVQEGAMPSSLVSDRDACLGLGG